MLVNRAAGSPLMLVNCAAGSPLILIEHLVGHYPFEIIVNTQHLTLPQHVLDIISAYFTLMPK